MILKCLYSFYQRQITMLHLGRNGSFQVVITANYGSKLNYNILILENLQLLLLQYAKIWLRFI